MTDKESLSPLTLDSPAKYRINVRGCLEEKWSLRLVAMQVSMNIPRHIPLLLTTLLMLALVIPINAELVE